MIEMLEKQEVNLNDIPLQAPENVAFSRPDLQSER